MLRPIFKDSKKEVNDFWLGQVLDVIHCINPDRSQFTKPKRGRLRAFEVDTDAAGEQLLFRLGEDSALVIVHDSIRSKLERANLKGLFFQASKSYNGKPASSYYRSGLKAIPLL